jgi:hypothetical protein
VKEFVVDRRVAPGSIVDGGVKVASNHERSQ